MNATQQEAREHASVMTTTALYRDLLREVYKSVSAVSNTHFLPVTHHAGSQFPHGRQETKHFPSTSGLCLMKQGSNKTRSVLRKT